MKGQMYIILAVLIVITLVILKTSLNLNAILENNRNLQASLDDLELKNIEMGIRQALVASYTLPNRGDNINYFIDFAKASESSRGNTLTGLSVQSSYPNVTTGSIAMSTSVHNILGMQIDNLTLVWSADGSAQSFVVADNATQSMTFYFAASNANHTLSMNYTASNVTASRNITIPVEVGKSRFIGFYTMALSTPQSTPLDEFTNVAVLNQTQYT